MPYVIPRRPVSLSEYREQTAQGLYGRRIGQLGHEQASDASVRRWFLSRGITPTLAEYREVAACLRNGSNPLGIH